MEDSNSKDNIDSLSKLNWYVGLMKAYQDEKVAQSLISMGIEHFFPVRKERRRWSDRIKIVNVPLIRGVMFIRTDNRTRKQLLNDIFGLYSYMSKGGIDNPVIVPEKQMKTFMDFVNKDNENVEFYSGTLKPGDKVVVVRGPLTGMECELIKLNGKNYARVQLASLGNAISQISVDDVRKCEASDK